MYKPCQALVPFLYFPGIIYQSVVFLRNRAFDAGYIPVYNMTPPVVSVGNLTMGGTGKTPFVIYLAALIKKIGFDTAILTRGYGRRGLEKTVVLSPGENVDFTAYRIGDEPALIRRRLPETWLGISSDRISAANAISRRHGSDDRMVFILDDGFQRRSIHRDLDIVMIDPAQLPGDDRMFPMGGLLEPVSELRRTRIIVINGTGLINAPENKNAHVDAIVKNLRKYSPDADYFHCVQQIQKIIPFSDWLDFEAPHRVTGLPGTALLVAAIGNPERFMRDIKSIGIETLGCAFFRDHAVIDKKDWEVCVNAARKVKSEAIIITEKDAVKISSPPDYPLFVAVQTTDIPEVKNFCEILHRCINSRPAC